jgi:hypothetical protein
LVEEFLGGRGRSRTESGLLRYDVSAARNRCGGQAMGKLTVVLGAGASTGCAGNGIAATVKHEYRPPLAQEVFDQRFDPILRKFGRLATHLDDLRTELATSNANLEEVLREFYNLAERRDDRWPLDIPLYLRELFWSISDEYVEGSSKYDTLVQRVLSSSFEKVMFLNLNYDLFVEYALRDCNRHQFDTVDAYLPENKKWMLVKPHGSVNWARILKNWPQYASGDYKAFPSDLEETPIFCSSIQIALRGSQAPRSYYLAGIPERRLYPQLVVPIDDPITKRFICPTEHEDRARKFVQDCTTFVVIGFSGRDDDVLDVLQGMPGGSRVVLVSKNDVGEVFERISANGALNSKNLQFELYNDGFAEFVGSTQFKKLVAP